MKQFTFETKQRAEELMQEAIKIWAASDQAERLEGLKNDPVFSVIMGAMAYQANDIDSQIEQLKNDVLSEFSRTLSTGSSGNAVPTLLTIYTAPAGNQPMELNEDTIFTTANGAHEFMPVIRSKVFAVKGHRIERLDARRWMLTLDFPEPVDDIEGMTLGFSNQPYHDLRLSMLVDGKEQPVGIISPWNMSELPLTEPFTLDTLLYNRTNMVNTGGSRGNLSPYNCNAAMDMFARHHLNMFYVSKSPMREPMDSVKLIFEFEGIGRNFVFNTKNMAMNVSLLANVKVKTVTLSGAMPIARVAGNDAAEQFMYLLRPDRDQILSSATLMARRINVDRFTRTRFTKLLNYIIARYKADYHAFMSINANESDKYVDRIIDALQSMEKALASSEPLVSGVYVMLLRTVNFDAIKNLSLSVRYLVTGGSATSDDIDINSVLSVPPGFEPSETVQVAPPDAGLNEIRDETGEMSLRKYTLATNDRLVTPSDLKLFCYSELQTKYNIIRDLIHSIHVSHEPYDMPGYHTYCIQVEIKLKANQFVERAFDGKVEGVESYLEHMMQVRTVNIYPIKVKIIMMPKE